MNEATIERLQGKLWDVIEECVQADMPLDMLIGEIKICWEEAKKQKLKYELKQLRSIKIDG